MLSSSIQRSSMTHREFPLSTNSVHSEESVTLFIMGLGSTIMFWILISCICFIHYRHDNEKYNLLSQHRCAEEDIININLLSMKNCSIATEDLCLHISPFDNNQISSITTV